MFPYWRNPAERECQNCKKAETPSLPLHLCTRCGETLYCSRACQNANWEKHRCDCLLSPPDTENITENLEPKTPMPQLDVTVGQPFHKLHNGKWLHGRSERDVYKLLIDTYRLRLDDDCKFAFFRHPRSIYNDATDGGKWGFCQFLRMLHHRNQMLPEWWSEKDPETCVEFGCTSVDWNLAHPVEARDIAARYGNALMPVQLRAFGEQAYGSAPADRSFSSVVEDIMHIEAGKDPKYEVKGEKVVERES